MTAAPRANVFAVLRHRLLVAAVLVAIEIAAAWALGVFDVGARLLADGATAGVAIFVLGAFFCLRLVVYFVLPPVLAVGLVALVLPRTDFVEAAHAAHRSIRDRRARLSQIVRARRLG